MLLQGPGIIIGKKGADVEKLKANLKKLVGKEIAVNIKEERKPNASAQLAAESVAQQLERRVAFQKSNEKSYAKCTKSWCKRN